MNYFLYSLLAQLILIILLIILIYNFLKIKKVYKLEKKIFRFSVLPISRHEESFFDKQIKKYNKIIKKISKKLEKSIIVKRYAKHYEKYILKTNKIIQNQVDIISNKLVITLIFVLITIISTIIKQDKIDIINIFLSGIFGFFILDIYLYINSIRLKKAQENDFLKAVIIMSNAFKSGRSIMQAIEIVSKELEGPVGEEFKQMHIDLTYGLELETVFNRLAKRVDIEETKYMASSLVIINKTGGNIVKVFSSIEKSFFERKKLNDELKSVTALSRFVFKVLIAIPFLVFIMVSITSKDYFAPFISSLNGKLLLLLIILIYIIYIIVVLKIMKIRK